MLGFFLMPISFVVRWTGVFFVAIFLGLMILGHKFLNPDCDHALHA
jgi:hypothetical protein